MQENTFFYRTALSLSGAVSIGGFAAIVGAMWALALGTDVVMGAVILGAIGAIWGAISFQLTPTGGIIMENKTTVNYAVVALHGWFAALLSLVALIVLLIRQVM